MKRFKSIVFFVVIILVLSLSACSDSLETTPDMQETSTPIANETPDMQETSTPITNETSEPESASETDLAESVTSADVKVFYVADDAFNQIGESPHELVDLSNLESYREFIESEEITQRVIFTTDTLIKDFKYLAIDMAEGDTGFIVEDVICELEELLPEEPFVVTWWTLSTVRIHRGISFVDADGTTKYFAFHASGNDGSLFFIEF